MNAIQTEGYRYELVEGWGMEAKERWNIKEVAGIGISAQDEIFLLTRVQPPVVVMDVQGKVLDWFGEGLFVRPHGLHVDPDGSILAVDDGGHAVYCFDAGRKLVHTIGTPGVPSDTGCVKKDYRTIQRAAGPFHYPTRLAKDADGMIYVTDGYGNARVHKFDPQYRLVQSWGQPGTAPGRFQLPHGVAVDRNNLVYVADRQNNRVQRFTTQGEFVDQWTDLERPSDVFIDRSGDVYVAECRRTSRFDGAPSRISIFHADGSLAARLSADPFYDLEQGYRCAHGLVVDSEGSLYVTEVGKKLPEDFYGVKKYRRV